ncbi:nitronate monooxygenase family protein [Arthrobacter sp. ISL-95]|uniref:NAD(P)H-dependent flavin oxidoreductase n=1 Tax=Arthrobacter sp. ISL-95 TaxID=2819116 RepID=UPI001BE9878E|nr:nitronate monooxygenase [Arthrobacter sp. ISL-95]MBT2588423.1 nitronate monooxygenase [Arthrobacter sp. ISL-95]
MSLDPLQRNSLVLPVVCAPMAGVSGPELVREACKSGIMGVLPRHNAADITEFGNWLRDIRRALEDHQERYPAAIIGPLAVNYSRRWTSDEMRVNLDLCARYGVEVIISAMGDPTELTQTVHGWGGKVFHDVTSMRFAEKAISAGVDGLTCIVGGGGGHSGLLSPFVFIPQVRSIFDGTVLLAGTVSTGAAIRSAEVLGADLAYLGTRFIATKEANVPPAYRRMLVEAKSTDLIYTTSVTAVPANWLKPSLISHGLDPEDLPVSSGRGNYDHLPPKSRPWRDIWSAGQGIDLIYDTPSVADLVHRLSMEYRTACQIPEFGPLP